MEVFDVFHGGEAVGSVTVKREGLYYLLSCHCKRLEGVLRLVLHRENGCVSVGICVPEGAGMGICRRVPIKRLGAPPWQFSLTEGNKEVFVPLEGALPTAALVNLESARFCRREGQPGLLFPYLPEL
ncbi:MAG: hypothetical protein IKU07_06370 [Oscillospiraceae bacterium]|nr:hypothetical protein [Oscillospiraceae bacterium]